MKLYLPFKKLKMRCVEPHLLKWSLGPHVRVWTISNQNKTMFCNTKISNALYTKGCPMFTPVSIQCPC